MLPIVLIGVLLNFTLDIIYWNLGVVVVDYCPDGGKYYRTYLFVGGLVLSIGVEKNRKNHRIFVFNQTKTNLN